MHYDFKVIFILRIWKKKIQKKKNVATWKPRACMWVRFLFFDFFPHKSVKREKLAHFCHALLFLANVSLRRKN